MSTVSLSSIGQARDWIQQNAARAEKQDALRRNGHTVDVEDYIFVHNRTDDRVATVASTDYQLVQHPQFFDPVLEAVSAALPDVSQVTIRDDRERVDVEILPDRPTTIKDEDFRIGVRFSNSFDRSVRARTSPFILRLVCSNGMLGRSLFDQRHWRHYGNAVDPKKAAKDVRHLVGEANDQLPSVINRAASLRVEEPEFVLEEAGFGPRYREEILERPGTPRTAWRLYNDTTYVVEHEHDVAESTRENLHARAEKILTGEAVREAA